ncbi:hypothetical protein SPBRAN_1276 [uncultured Candidatus Thioglobus sp.]|nr:hypothetical protein SPBRAN_1276 [uncultured Candidatus Thioglobus sp.]
MFQKQQQMHEKMSLTHIDGLHALNEQQYYEVSNTPLSGFIHHPTTFPLSYRRIWFDHGNNYAENKKQALGLCFKSKKRMKLGIKLEIAIPIKNSTEYLRGKVVFIRAMPDHFEIGIWLMRHEDISRARAVEKICHIETYLRAKKYQDGPFVSKEHIAEEWMKKYETTFHASK